jgi:hypothetical protein
MGTRLFRVVNLLLSLTVLASVVSLHDLGYSIEKYDESPGVYYENKGMANLYNVEWKTIVYVNLNGVGNETLALRQYLHHIDVLCQTAFIRNWAGCTRFHNEAKEKLAQLTGTMDLLEEITGHEAGINRKKRGALNFVGQLSKILFGTMDENDADYYNEQIKLFEQNSEDMTTLLKQQLCVVKSSLGAVNNTNRRRI